jgi:hypothetical protein
MRILETVLGAIAVVLITGSVLSFSVGFDPTFKCDNLGFWPSGGDPIIICGDDCDTAFPCVPFTGHDGR